MDQTSAPAKFFYKTVDLKGRWGVSLMASYRGTRRGRLRKRHIGAVRFSADEVGLYERPARVS